ncbi:MAG: photosystem I protein PsaX [Cyanobacteria bacterium P01_A01_bin.45]
MANTDKAVASSSNAKFPYPYRLGWALLLLVGNFLVAAFYFNILA